METSSPDREERRLPPVAKGGLASGPAGKRELFRPGESRVAELDGVRGVAVLLVILFHFGSPALKAPGGVLERALKPLVELGWCGVDLFFVLSGCLITGVLVETRRSNGYFRAFYARRALRLLPLYYGFLALFFGLALPLARHYGRMAGFGGQEQIWYWLHLSNWRSAWGIGAGSALGHFWSLAIEEQFYAVWPLVVYFLAEGPLALVCAAIAAASIGLRWLPQMQASSAGFPELLYRLTPFRLEGLAFGSLVALALRRRELCGKLSRFVPFVWALSAAAFLHAAWLDFSTLYLGRAMRTFGYTALAGGFAACVFQSVWRAGAKDWRGGWLRGRFLMSCGKYSYAMYVLHLPLALYLPVGLSMVGLGRGAAAALASVALGGFCSYGLGWLSWHLLERHFLRLKGWFLYGGRENSADGDGRDGAARRGPMRYRARVLKPVGAEPLVSVLIANYNYAHLLGETLESVWKQTYPHLEVIVCDDGSTDDSAAVLAELSHRDRRLSVVRQANGGMSAAFNAAFREARGELIALLDADDVWLPNRLEQVVAAFRREPAPALW